MSYIKIWLHCVWSTKNRDCRIPFSFRPDLLKHLRDNARAKNIILDYINVHEDHVHALINLGKQQSVAEVMHLLKGESSFWINSQRVLPYQFEWQDDYFALSISHAHVDRVRHYIKHQDEHHRKVSLEQEAGLLLKKYGFEAIKD